MKDQLDDGTLLGDSAVDPRIIYPTYKSFDEFIDLDRLKSLNEYLIEKINVRIAAAQKDSYFLNLYRLDRAAPYQPGVREIWLTETRQNAAYNYFDLDQTNLWQPSAAATEEFPRLMEFIETLPFKDTGRILIMYDDAGKSVPAHRDHLETEICHEFIWFRTNLKKPFYMLNHQTGAKQYVESYSAWFDSVNQFHGSDAVDGLSFSIRVDGHFSDAFKKQIPLPAHNLASAPALWVFA